MVGTSTLSHLPASAMMVRSNAATTTVTPMGTFLSLMHLRLKPGDKPRGRGTAGKPMAQRAPQAPCSSCVPPTGAFNTFKYSHKARGGGHSGVQAQFRGCIPVLSSASKDF